MLYASPSRMGHEPAPYDLGCIPLESSRICIPLTNKEHGTNQSNVNLQNQQKQKQEN